MITNSGNVLWYANYLLILSILSRSWMVFLCLGWFFILSFSPLILSGQCTYDVNGPNSSSYFVAAGEEVCLHAGAVFTDSITLNGGTLTNDATAPQAFTLTTNSGSTGNIFVNNGTFAYSGSMSFHNTLTITNNGTFSTGGNFSLSTSVTYINNDSTIVGGKLLNQGDLVNTGTIIVTEFMRGNSASDIDNQGTIEAFDFIANNTWSNSGTFTVTDTCEMTIGSSGTINGGCMSCGSIVNEGNITGTTCGDLEVQLNSTHKAPGAFTGTFAFIDLTPPPSAPFIDTNMGGTVGASITWTSCAPCSSTVPEICGNTIDDNSDGRIDEPYPGGIETSLQLWLKAETGTNTSVNGADVTSWADQSTNFYSADADVSSVNDPVYSTSSINFNPGVVFPGTSASDFSDGLHLGADFIYSNNLEMNIFAVVDPENDNEKDNFIVDFGHYDAAGYGVSYSNNRYGMYTSGTRTDQSHAFGGEAALIGANIDFGNEQTFLRNGSSLNSRPIGSLNQLDATNINESPNYQAASTSGPFSIGRVASSDGILNDGGRIFNGAISEIIIFNDSLTSNEKKQVNSYLALKYGITLNHDYLSASGAAVKQPFDGYDNNIFGIGRDDCSGLYQKQSKSVEEEGIITLSLGAIAASNQSNVNTLNVDESFLIIGDDGAAANTWDLVGATYPGYRKVGRTWRVDHLNMAENVTITIDMDDPDLNIPALPTNAVGSYKLIANSSSDFNSGGTVINDLTNTSGSLYEMTSSFSGVSYFTLAYLGPSVETCNNGIDDDGDGNIDCLDDECATAYGGESQTSVGDPFNPQNIVGIPDGNNTQLSGFDTITVTLENAIDTGVVYSIPYSTMINSTFNIEESIDGVNWFVNPGSPLTMADPSPVAFTSSIRARYIRISEFAGFGIGVLDGIGYDNCVCTPSTTMTPEYQINGGTAVQDDSVNVSMGSDLVLNFVGTSFTTWAFVWSGPNLYQVNDSGAGPRDTLSFTNIQTNQSGTYYVYYYDDLGCVDSTAFYVNVLEPENCSDGIDNDGDGLIDCLDSLDCQNFSYTTFTVDTCQGLNANSIVVGTTNGVGVILQYSIDGGSTFQFPNAFNGLSTGTYNIRVRNWNTGCFEDYSGNPVVISNVNCVEICNDGIDNDADGQIDTADSDCCGAQAPTLQKL